MVTTKKYMMHKYWGKKPSKDLQEMILKYSKKQDVLLDPFAGYGVFSSEAILNNRNVISNDLNPMSNFINERLLSSNIDFNKMSKMIKSLEIKTIDMRKKWYYIQNNDITFESISVLRNNRGTIKKIKMTKLDKLSLEEYIPEKLYVENFSIMEREYKILDWFPDVSLIENSRISAKKGMRMRDLFDKRSLASHAYLFSLINQFEESEEKKLLLLAFTSNLANCSKLVPPIKSRGDISQGAWMTGYYIGKTYIENNVFHYFFNRVKKIVAGKTEFIKEYNYSEKNVTYKVTNEDAKELSILSNSIDFIFTDFPYGDSVPYFEQSFIWNSWLRFNVDYENEIVISNSNKRNKNKESFQRDIDQAVGEIYRVLKKNKYFVFTYHSLSGFEWYSLTNAILKNGFEVCSIKALNQKTFPPRQLNRKQSIKGDLVVVCKKSNVNVKEISEKAFEEIALKTMKSLVKNNLYETNDIIVSFLKKIFEMKILLHDFNMIDLLKKVAIFDGNGWKINE